MTAIEIMALIVAVFILGKMITVFINQNAWFDNLTTRFWSNSILVTVTSLIISVVTLYYLLGELTIVQIGAAFLFFGAFTVFGLAQFSKEMLKFEEIMFKDKDMLKKGWLPSIAWTAFGIWIVYALFA